VESSLSTSNLLWFGSHVKPALLLGLHDYQKVNHFPGTHEITRKDLLARTLGSMRERHGVAAYDFLPTTFVLPADRELATTAMARERSTWIVKPIASSRGAPRHRGPKLPTIECARLTAASPPISPCWPRCALLSRRTWHLAHTARPPVAQ